MLIYFRHGQPDGMVTVVEVTHGARGTKDNKIHKPIEKAHETHQKLIKELEEDEILVLGNSSVLGNGIFKDNLFVQYTGIESKHPQIFTPHPEVKPDQPKVEEKYRKARLSYLGKIMQQRAEDIKAGRTPISHDEIDDLEEKFIAQSKEEMREEIANLKTYRELGMIVEPVCVKQL